MRDTIKSKEYFDEYILKMSEGIKRFEEGIALSSLEIKVSLIHRKYPSLVHTKS